MMMMTVTDDDDDEYQSRIVAGIQEQLKNLVPMETFMEEYANS
jgi:hypothetical protein